MENVRLIYEQIEQAKKHLIAGSLLQLRLALILLDNAAELMMYRELEHEFSWYDQWEPKWEPWRTQWIEKGLGPKYTQEERRAAEREFEPKARILALRLGRISSAERDVLCVCHRIRCEAFHRGLLRHEILLPVCQLLYLTVAALTIKLPVKACRVPGPNPHPEDGDFLLRFGISNALSLVSENGREQLHSVLIAGVVFDVAAFCRVLSEDLGERIENTIGNLAYLGETSDERTMDHNLQFTQFWRSRAAELAKQGVREPKLSQEFEEWKIAGNARYTMKGLKLWQKRAEAISNRRNPVHALVEYWAIDKRFSPFEQEIVKAVLDCEDQVDAEIHSRRL